MLYSLIITICAINAPAHCQVYEQPMEHASATPNMAFVEAQGILAQWLEQHPGYKLQHWRLEPGQGS
ncbi:MAG: hypothetical protein E6Q98_09990 [Rhodospirillaceae bacterium]|nr:MAG: hypothetical protein E6Q98_09990 [Rhodospirillaceae bacterium]